MVLVGGSTAQIVPIGRSTAQMVLTSRSTAQVVPASEFTVQTVLTGGSTTQISERLTYSPGGYDRHIYIQCGSGR